MWLNRKKDKDFSHNSNLQHTIISAPIGPLISIPLDTDFALNGLSRKDDLRSSKKVDRGSGIRKKILQFGARVQGYSVGGSSFLSSNGIDSSLSAKELFQLEETKNRLFLEQSSCENFCVNFKLLF